MTSKAPKPIHLRITKADLTNAQKEYKECEKVSCSCLVYQVAKRKGIDVFAVGFSRLRSTENKRYELSPNGQKITEARVSDWPSLVGVRFSITELE